MLTITHSHTEGTLIDGTQRGDGTNTILKAAAWRWSARLGSWYLPQTRDKAAKTARIAETARALREAGHDVDVQIDDTRRSAAEVEAAREARAVERVDALAERADRLAAAARAADGRLQAADAKVPPMGEPIKIGHHSAGRHQRALDSARDALTRSVEADRTAEAAARRVETSRAASAGRTNPVTVANRLERLSADRRRAQRALEALEQEHDGELDERLATYRDRHAEEIARLDEEIEHWQQVRTEQLADGSATNFGKDSVTAGDVVQIRGAWRRVVRVSAKSVTVLGEFGPGRIPWHEVQAHRTRATGA